MKGFFILTMFFLLPLALFGQAIAKGSGVLYTSGVPSFAPNLAYDSEIALDTSTGLWYERGRDCACWVQAGFRVQKLSITVAPTYTPGDKFSEVVLNAVDSLYRWRAGAWRHINKGGGGGGSYTAGTGISISGSVISNTGDLSDTNEGALTVAVGSATTSIIQSNTTGSTGVTIAAGANMTVTESGNTITINPNIVGSFRNDFHAGANGVPVGGLYEASEDNTMGMPYGDLRRRKN